MVVLGRTAVIVLAAGAFSTLAILLVALAVSVRRHRAMSRRLVAVATRLDLPGAGDGERGEDGVTRLERLAQEAVLRVSEADARVERMGGALEQVPHGVVVVDERAQYVHRNSALTKMVGTPHGQLVDEALSELLVAALAGQGGSRTVQLVGPARRSFVVSGRPLDDGRRTLGAVAMVEETSERHRLEVVRRSFVENFTAELKTPLGALALLAGAIVAEDDPALTRRLARRLQEDCLRVGRIVDDLMELRRVDTELAPEDDIVPVHLLVAQAVETARSDARRRHISIVAPETSRLVSVCGDRRQLVSALRRLVDNAVRFSAEGSEVAVEVAVDDDWVDVAVHDQGVGIPERDLDRIFECFYRVDRDGSSDAAGTGLGLAIASQVASRHGGMLLVASEEHQGSVFTLRLPAAPGTGAAPVRRAG